MPSILKTVALLSLASFTLADLHSNGICVDNRNGVYVYNADATAKTCTDYFNRNTGSEQWDTCLDCTLITTGVPHCESAGWHIGGDEVSFNPSFLFLIKNMMKLPLVWETYNKRLISMFSCTTIASRTEQVTLWQTKRLRGVDGRKKCTFIGGILGELLGEEDLGKYLFSEAKFEGFMARRYVFDSFTYRMI
ncbi:hypothetical protein BHYA_0218g00140 [Botrytis hyacinthi]|uniref:Cyanovirin-N domain-containing protein n=1 Tax=Botrytis hyacinthi TaxID=278943 RepID=A0A4Z1GHP8_9HELO|nr:hypothetical protein BHYA_0218g00140 [Botrytis hyacinthi]